MAAAPILRMVLRFAVWLAPALLAGPALAQAMPNHADPSARDPAPDTSAVPALRFLTTADFPPFNYRDGDGDLVGFNVDVARSLCTQLKVACTIQAWPWDQAGRALLDNQGDALIAGVAITPENGSRYDFTNIYLALPARFVTVQAAAPQFDPLALSGRRVAVRRGSTHQEFLRRYLPEAVLVEFDGEFDALAAVRSGDVAAYFGDGMRAAFWLNQNPDCCAFAGKPYFRPDLFGEGFAIAVPPGHDAVRLALDYGLRRLAQEGTIEEIYLRWFPIGFY